MFTSSVPYGYKAWIGVIHFDLFNEEEFHNIRFRFLIIHEHMCLMYVILKLLLEHGYDVFAPSYGFK